MSIFDR